MMGRIGDRYLRSRGRDRCRRGCSRRRWGGTFRLFVVRVEREGRGGRSKESKEEILGVIGKHFWEKGDGKIIVTRQACRLYSHSDQSLLLMKVQNHYRMW